MGTGSNSRTLIGKQAAKGTEATTYTQVLSTGNSMNTKYSTAFSKALTGNRFTAGGFTSKMSAEGGTPAEITKESLQLFLEFAGFTLNAGKWSIGQNIATWATVVKELMDEAYHEKYVDCKINDLAIKVEKESYVAADVAWLGISGTEIATAFAGTVSKVCDESEAVPCLDTVITIGGTDITGEVESLEIKISNNIDGEHYPINSINRKSLEAQEGKIELTATVEFAKAKYIDYKDKIKNSTPVVSVINIGADIEINLPKIKWQEISADISGKERIKCSLKGMAYYDTTAQTAMFVEIA